MINVQVILLEVLRLDTRVRAVDRGFRAEVRGIGKLGAEPVRRHILEAAQQRLDTLQCIPIVRKRTGHEREASFPESIHPIAALPATRGDTDDDFCKLRAEGGDRLRVFVELPRVDGVLEAMGW